LARVEELEQQLLNMEHDRNRWRYLASRISLLIHSTSLANAESPSEPRPFAAWMLDVEWLPLKKIASVPADRFCSSDAERWLRGAEPGQRSVELNGGVYRLVGDHFLGDGHQTTPTLPFSDEYMPQYFVGMRLAPPEATAYLTASEDRRCLGAGGGLVRIPGGLPIRVQSRHGRGDWYDVHNGKLNGSGYTIVDTCGSTQ
jgi:hypothetical protein